MDVLTVAGAVAALIVVAIVAAYLEPWIKRKRP